MMEENMNKIMIVEDEVIISSHLIEIAKKVNPDIDIYTTGLAAEALDYLNTNDINAFFLDIQLEDYSGIHLAKEIRAIKRYEFTPIIFITAMPTRELEAFRQIHCYDYIIKPFLDADIEEVFEKILLNYIDSKLEEKQEKVMLRFKSYTQLVSLRDIIYVEYRNRKIIISTEQEDIEYIHMALRKFKEELTEDFIQVHQSFIVNKAHVNMLNTKKQCILLSHKEVTLPIGRSYQLQIRGVFDEF